jgi:hypothetical protein
VQARFSAFGTPGDGVSVSVSVTELDDRVDDGALSMSGSLIGSTATAVQQEGRFASR